jgi:hypothetical protein
VILLEGYYLTIEKESEDVIHIHANKKGLQFLKSEIEYLLSSDSNNHTHLFTESWGGSELTEELPHSNQTNIVHHIKLFKWNDDDF